MDLFDFIDRLDQTLEEFSKDYPFEITIDRFGERINLIIVDRQTKRVIPLKMAIEMIQNKDYL